MAHIFKKYEFQDEATADSRIAALPSATDEEGNSYPTHSHTIVKLGHLVVTEGTYDDEGNQLTAPVLASNYSIDVLWNEEELLDENGDIAYPYGWASKEVEYSESWVSPNGAHTFFGWSFNS